MAKSKKKSGNFQYEVALSFAGENRAYVEKVAAALVQRGVRVFYDSYEQVELWGKDLYAHLDDVYQNVALYCIMFISHHYAKKLWTSHERRSAQARAFRESQEYILPARFDGTAIPGVPDTIAYINLRRLKPHKFADLIVKKIGPRKLSNFVPPTCDILYKSFRVKSQKQKSIIRTQAELFGKTLQRMSVDERRVLLTGLWHSCMGELPGNVHVSFDLLRRCTGFSISKIKRLLSGMVSLGITCKVGYHSDDHSEGEMAFLDYTIRTTADYRGNAIAVANEMVYIVKCDYCNRCDNRGMDRLMRGDFSSLSSATRMKHDH